MKTITLKPDVAIAVGIGVVFLLVVAFMAIAGGRSVFDEPKTVRAVQPVNWPRSESDRDRERCRAAWLDINFKSHCGHQVKFLWRETDSTKTPLVDVYHCLTDSVRVLMPIPRYFYADK